MSAILIPADFEKRISDAVNLFWYTRTKQISKQNKSGKKDQGNRGAVTGGKQLDGFVELVREILILNEVPEECVYTNSNLELPGYYRPNKKWDLLVVDKNQLIIAVEFKSQAAPSFGNNFNNRTEEAMGSALDIWTAFREGAFGNQKAPWIGYFLLLEDCQKSSVPIRVRSPHFPVFPEFNNISYKERYRLFCSKLLLERQYSSACFTTTGYSNGNAFYDFPADELSFRSFISSMLGAVISHDFQ